MKNQSITYNLKNEVVNYLSLAALNTLYTKGLMCRVLIGGTLIPVHIHLLVAMFLMYVRLPVVPTVIALLLQLIPWQDA